MHVHGGAHGHGALPPLSLGLVQAACGSSPGALLLWQRLEAEARGGALPLLQPGATPAALQWCDSRFADVLVCLTIADLSYAELRAGAADWLLAPAPYAPPAALPDALPPLYKMPPKHAVARTPSDNLRSSNLNGGAASPVGLSPPAPVGGDGALAWAWPSVWATATDKGGALGGGATSSRLLRSVAAGGSDLLPLVAEHARGAWSSEAGRREWLGAFCDGACGGALRAEADAAVEIEKAALVVAHARRLQAVRLVDCVLSDADATRLAAAWASAAPSLQSIQLGGNNIGRAGAAAIAAALPASVRVLGLERNSLGDAGAAELAALLQRNDTLTLLDLSTNAINAGGLLPLLDALAANDAIQQLDLRHNHIHEQNPALEPRWAVIGGEVPVRPRVRLRD